VSLTAVIPVAGLGTRLAPATRAVTKALFPLVCPDGSVRPVADLIAREAVSARCERICFVTSPGQAGPLRKYFEHEADLSERVSYVEDVEPLGFGYAVFSAREFAGDGPVMVFLGDHIHLSSPPAASPAAQVAEAFLAARPAAMVGVQLVDRSRLHLVGVCRGEPVEGRAEARERSSAPRANTYRCTEIAEKPDLALATERLVTPSLPPGTFLAHAGIYAFTAEIFDCLAPLVAARGENAEVGLTEAQQVLLARHDRDYLLRLVEGDTYDLGTPAGYLAGQKALAGYGFDEKAQRR